DTTTNPLRRSGDEKTNPTDAKGGKGFVLEHRHFVTVTKRTGQDVFLEYRRHATDTPKYLGQGCAPTPCQHLTRPD
ncbi:hypothetical protein, partial [Salmonella enterica]|uniref:hypothetical protein n=1 Tax=Salmonella enterica TaxID=28901 RepID=UPI001F3EA8C7